jgi:uncharacterized protein (DUF885 family)
MDSIMLIPEVEVDSYIIWPEQTCASKMGELRLLELNKMAQNALNNYFDIKEFHTIILQNSSPPPNHAIITRKAIAS